MRQILQKLNALMSDTGNMLVLISPAKAVVYIPFIGVHIERQTTSLQFIPDIPSPRTSKPHATKPE